MNPFFFHVYRDDPSPPLVERKDPPIENPATAHDRAYIAAQVVSPDAGMLVYNRPPVAGEWHGTVPGDAVVHVFVINAWTTVRALQLPSGQRIGEPVMDSWYTAVTPSVGA